MSERIVNDPSLHGWVEENGKWVWEGGATTGHIEDGTVQGQITTWDVAKTEWTPDSSLTIDASGDATFSRDVTARNFMGSLKGWSVASSDNTTGFAFNAGQKRVEPFDGSKSSLAERDNLISIGSANGRFKNAYFSGTVQADSFVDSDGNPIGGGGGTFDLGSGFVLENKSAPADNQKFGINVQDNGALRFQARNDAGGGGGNYFQFDRTNNNATQLGCYRSGVLVGQWDISTNALTAQNYTALSDERLKDNITTAPVGLIDSLKGREWDWKESGEKGSGVVAQELEQILPHLVSTDDEGMKSVAYNGLVAYLIEEIKALKAEVEALK